MNTVPFVIAAIIMFALLVASHEFGHFASAKLLGVRVNEFSIGMGPLIFQRKKGETEYSLRALPIGGFCRIEGEDGDSESGSDDERSFAKKPWWAKVIILASGAFMNILLCLLILTMVFVYSGTCTNYLDEVLPGGPADLAGIKPGDRIIAIDGKDYSEWEKIVGVISGSDGKPMSVSVLRDGERLTFDCAAVESEGRWVLGIICKLSHSPFAAFRQSLSATAEMFNQMRLFFAQLFVGKVNTDDVVGVVGIVSIMSEQSKYGFASLAYLVAIISLNLGLVNLLPLPALDGGRILFVFVRLIFGGRISDKAEAYVHAAGMILLMALMVFLVIKDVKRFVL